ncbi:SIR2 family protein [Gracilibacillus sp. YIM 98692]|uniref:SIR2 family protein n=1 Tax=Gracilibacillus sp. YIM 98692 TaxID=2663532 RepID=UPI0013D1F87A|nr:SIR2 family protein [Gracilibacillus sp. YIM 98692]
MSIYDNYLNESLVNLQSVMDDSGTRPILFIGTGLSIRYLNGPDWQGLLELLVEQNPRIKYPLAYYKQTTPDLPSVASELVDEYKDYAWENYSNGTFPDSLYDPDYSKSIFLKYQICDIFNSLLSQFNLDDNKYSKEIELLSNLQPHAIITTNYDSMLETIFPSHSIIIGQQVIKSKSSSRFGQILKIHGCTSKPEEIVISKEDYHHFEVKQKYLTAKLLTYFMEHPIIFLGYSVSDMNIKSILSDIAEIVCENEDEIVSNIWFIDWTKEEINPDMKPPNDKTIDLGDGKSIRVNYLLVNSFDRLYESLYQGSESSVDAIKDLEGKVYNIIKSKSISDLEVDFLTMRSVENETKLGELIGFRKKEEETSEHNNAVSVIGVGTISDPEQIKTRYPFRLSDVAEELGLSHWMYAHQLIVKIEKDTEINIKETSNIYHFDVSVVPNQPQHRYSKDAISLLEKVLNGESYSIFNEKGEEIHPYSLQNKEFQH